MSGGPNSLWHSDGLHKVIYWEFVIHACTDGFSRMVNSLVCASDNRAETASKAFLSGVKLFGLPARVRGDCVTENVAIAEYMQQQQSYVGAYIYGLSVDNQRIERLHYDTTHCVLGHYIDLFLYMEEEGILDRNSIIDLFALHYIYQLRIQASLDEFKEGWSHHPVSTEKNSTPYQIWLMGMMDSKYETRRGVRSYLELNGMDVNEFGIDPDMTFNNSREDNEEHVQAQSENLTIKFMKYWNS